MVLGIAIKRLKLFKKNVTEMGISNLLIYAMVSTNAQVVSIAEVVPESIIEAYFADSRSLDVAVLSH